jgi:hypothetical protein
MRELEAQDVEGSKLEHTRELVDSTQDKKPPFTVIKETDTYILCICPDCGEPKLHYPKKNGRKQEGKRECFNKDCYSRSLSKYLTDKLNG